MDTSWSGTTRLLVVLLVLAGAVWLLAVAAPLWQAIAIGALLAYLFDPVVRFLMRRLALRRSWAAALVFTVTTVLLLGIPAALGTVFVSWISRISSDLLTAAGQIEEWIVQPIQFLGFRIEPQDMLDALRSLFTDLIAVLPTGSLNVISAVTTNLVWAVVVFVMFYYLLKDGPKIKPWLITLPPQDHRPEIKRLLDEIDLVWGKFLRIQVLMFILITALMALGTLLIVGLFRFGLLRWSLLGFILLLVLLYTGIQQLDNLWIRPQILGRQLRLHPGVVFAGLIGALMLSGILGALLIVPLIATGKLVGNYVHRKMLGLPPWPEEEDGGETVTATVARENNGEKGDEEGNEEANAAWPLPDSVEVRPTTDE